MYYVNPGKFLNQPDADLEIMVLHLIFTEVNLNLNINQEEGAKTPPFLVRPACASSNGRLSEFPFNRISPPFPPFLTSCQFVNPPPSGFHYFGTAARMDGKKRFSRALKNSTCRLFPPFAYTPHTKASSRARAETRHVSPQRLRPIILPRGFECGHSSNQEKNRPSEHVRMPREADFPAVLRTYVERLAQENLSP